MPYDVGGMWKGLKQFDRNTIRRGLKLFFGLSIASITLVFFFTEPARTLDALREVRPLYLAAALGLAFADWLGGGFRMWLLTRGLSARLPFRACVKAALAQVSMGALTPSQAAGGPAQVFVLYKNGLPFVEAVSASLMAFVVTIIFFVLSAGTVTFFDVAGSIQDSHVYTLFRIGVTAFMIFGVVFIVFVSKPEWLRTVIRWFFNFLSLFRKGHFVRPDSVAQRILEAVDEFHETNVEYFSRRLPVLLLALVVTATTFGLKCLIAWFIVRGLGVDAGVWEVVSVQIVILLAVYFFPTPGGTGAAELGAAVLMSSLLPVGTLTVFVILWRLIVTYLAVAVGAVVMIRALGQDTLITSRPGYGRVEKKIAVSGE